MVTVLLGYDVESSYNLPLNTLHLSLCVKHVVMMKFQLFTKEETQYKLIADVNGRG